MPEQEARPWPRWLGWSLLFTAGLVGGWVVIRGSGGLLTLVVIVLAVGGGIVLSGPPE